MVVATIYRETKGNPFFVEEIVRHLEAQGRDLSQPATAMSEWGIPEGVKQVLGRRLSRLTPNGLRVLQAGSVLENDFDPPVLEAATGLDAATVTEALEEALNIGLIQDSGTCHFSHPLVREAVYDELSLPRRQRLHLQVAEAIESVHAASIEAHLSALAAHFRSAGAAASTEKAVAYSVRAAEAAQAIFAWEEAVLHYERALQALDLSGTKDDSRRCDLLFALAGALGPAGEPERVAREVGEEAIALAEALGDRSGAAKICRLALMALHRLGRGLGSDPELAIRWTNRADQYAEPDTVERVFADTAREILRGQPGYGPGGIGSDSFQTGLSIFDLARRFEDAEAYFFAARMVTTMSGTIKHEPERRLLAEEIVSRSRQGASSRTLASVLTNCGFLFLHAGDRPRAEAIWNEVAALAYRSQDASALLYPLIHEGNLLWLDGRLEEAVALATRLMQQARDQGSPDLIAFALRFSAPALIHLGRAEEIGSPLFPLDQVAADSAGYRLLRLAYMGRKEEGAELLSEALSSLPDGPEADEVANARVISLLEAAVLLEAKDAAARLIPLIEPISRSTGIHSQSTAIGRHLGAAAKLLGRPAEALEYTQQAIEACEKIGFRPELALSRLQLAELLLEHDPDARAIAFDHLDFAISEFEAMKMQPALDRALRLRGRRRAALEPKAPHYPDSLSEREVEVLRLVAAGKSNQQIADELVISFNTAQRHVSNIFTKTGLHNRAEAATYAHRSGLA
jgi:DNA-binding CsgD family transcriptional regulator